MSGADPAGRDPDLRGLLARAAPGATTLDPGSDVDADLRRGRAALGRRRSLLATLAVGAGTALVAAAAVLVPQGLTERAGTGGAPASLSVTAPDGRDGTRADRSPDGSATAETGGPADPVELVAGPQQQAGDVVATLVPAGWEVLRSAPDSLVLGRDGEVVTVGPTAGTRGPPVLGGVGDFERVTGSRVSYYLVDDTDGTPRPTMVLELTYGSWAQVSASPVLGWGMDELTAFAGGLRAPFTCTDPCEVPLAP